MGVSYFTPLWHEDHKYLTAIIRGKSLSLKAQYYQIFAPSLHSFHVYITSLYVYTHTHTHTSIIHTHLHHTHLHHTHLTALVKICPDRELTDKWLKDQDLMESIKVRLGFEAGVQVSDEF